MDYNLNNQISFSSHDDSLTINEFMASSQPFMETDKQIIKTDSNEMRLLRLRKDIESK